MSVFRGIPSNLASTESPISGRRPGSAIGLTSQYDWQEQIDDGKQDRRKNTSDDTLRNVAKPTQPCHPLVRQAERLSVGEGSDEGDCEGRVSRCEHFLCDKNIPGIDQTRISPPVMP